MDFIRTATTETTHALADLLYRKTDGGKAYGRTWCGVHVHGRTGGTIPHGIDCGNCVRVMRKEGWQV